MPSILIINYFGLDFQRILPAVSPLIRVPSIGIRALISGIARFHLFDLRLRVNGMSTLRPIRTLHIFITGREFLSRKLGSGPAQATPEKTSCANSRLYAVENFLCTL